MALNCSQVAIGDSRRRVWRMCATLFVVGLFVASWFVSGTQVTRAIFAFVAVASLMLAVELSSGALHGWPILVALGTSAAFSMVLFFVIQGVFVLAESRLSIHTWPVTMARTWTLVILLASSPLLIDPGLRVFGF